MSYTESTLQQYPAGYINVHSDRNGSYISSQSNAMLMWTKTRSGSKVWGYKQRIAQRVSASSGYSRSDYFVDQVTSTRGTCRDIDPILWDMDQYSGTHGLLTGLKVPSARNSTRTRALKKFREDLHDKMTAMQSLPFLGEIDKTRKLLRQPLQAFFSRAVFDKRQLHYLAKDFRYVKRIKWREAAKRLSDKYLEIKFGWTPFIKDIEDVSTALNRQLAHVEHIRGSATDTWFDTGGKSYNIHNTLLRTSHRQYETSVRYKYVAAVKLQPSLPQSWGVDLRSIPGACWELTPWSFLVDYFVDVQGFIGNLQTAGFPFVYGTLSERLKQTLRAVETVGPAGVDSRLIYAQPGSSKLHRVAYSRTGLSAMPFYVPNITLWEQSDAHLLNIAALLGGTIKPWK